MKRIAPLIVAVIIITIFGIGCFSKDKPADPVVNPVVNPTSQIPDQIQQTTLETFGIIGEIDSKNNIITLILSDAGQEDILLPEGIEVDDSDIGLLARVSGEREPSSRIINASKFEKVDEPAIHITSPTVGATVTSPLIVSGFGRVFEQSLNWRIKNTEDEIVADGYGVTHADDIGQFGPFRLDIFLPALEEKDFTLEVFEISAKDGSDASLVSIPLKLLTTEKTTFNVYFSNPNKNSSGSCTKVSPSERTITKTSAVARAALLELLNGPTSEEKNNGNITKIPNEAIFNSIVLSNHVVAVDFDSSLKNKVFGACDKDMAYSQIFETLMQFSSVDDVDLTIMGEMVDF